METVASCADLPPEARARCLPIAIEVKEYFNPLGSAAAAITDTDAFATCIGDGESSTSAPFIRAELASPAWILGEELGRYVVAAENNCLADPQTLCLNNERFRAEVDWRDFSGSTGTAKVVPFGSDDSGLFWFFNEDNWEMLIKVLDGCGFNNRFWVFSAATTNVEYTLRVTDTLTGAVKEYFNPLGSAAAAITDTDAFAACP